MTTDNQTQMLLSLTLPGFNVFVGVHVEVEAPI